MRYKVVRETRWGDVKIRGKFKSKKSAEMFLEEYKEEAPHITGELKVVEEEPMGFAEEVLEELWEKKR